MANGNGKKIKSKQAALAVIENREFAILKANPETLSAIIAENVGSEGLTPFDLDRIKIPSGGGIAWTLPTRNGEVPAKSFEGVIIFHKLGRAYWQEGMEESGGGSPPDCTSDDGQIGIGTPGGQCAKCPLAQFGSDPKGGRRQACKQMKQLFIMRDESLLPVVLTLPPTSLAAAKEFMLRRLAAYGRPFWSVLTRFSLEKDKNKAGIEYAKVNLEVVCDLSPEQSEFFKALKQQLEPTLRQVQITQEDYINTEEESEQVEEVPV